VWLVLHLLAALVALLVAFSGGIGVKDFVFGAMTGSFLTAPLFAWMAMDTMNSDLVAVEHRDGPAMQGLTWFGLAFLTGFSLLFLGWWAFGWGA
jgi:Mn2+/Fe2+ NRAMP family transporter